MDDIHRHAPRDREGRPAVVVGQIRSKGCNRHVLNLDADGRLAEAAAASLAGQGIGVQQIGRSGIDRHIVAGRTDPRTADFRLVIAGEQAGPLPSLTRLLADLLTIRQLLGSLAGARIAWVGDANNVCRSLAQGCAKLGAELRVASPEGYGFSTAEADGLGIRQTADPAEAVTGASIVYTDVWVSMGQDCEAEARRAALSAYRVDDALMARAGDAWFLHCLPARRGEEVTDAVMDGPRSAVWRQAENRMHTARGAMAWMMGGES